MAKAGRLRVAVVGGGLGGTTVAALLQQRGFDVLVYEQAVRFDRIGAGINLGPNAMCVMQGLGTAKRMTEAGICPRNWISRASDTGEILNEMPLYPEAASRYGAPYLIMHRGDLHAILASAVENGALLFNKTLVDLNQDDRGVRLLFADGSKAEADIVIGADGINSRVRELLLGPEKPTYSGQAAHRAIFPSALAGDINIDDLTKWWSDDTYVLVYFLDRSKSEIYLVTGSPESEWSTNASFLPADLDAFYATFERYHPTVQRLLHACTSVSKWPVFERDPMPLWSRGRVVLLGDACHPMKPHMGAGAAMAMEDAAILARSLDSVDGADFETAFSVYEATRIGRTSKVQRVSHGHDWLRTETDPSWVYGYDAFSEPLIESAHADPEVQGVREAASRRVEGMSGSS